MIGLKNDSNSSIVNHGLNAESIKILILPNDVSHLNVCCGSTTAVF